MIEALLPAVADSDVTRTIGSNATEIASVLFDIETTPNVTVCPSRFGPARPCSSGTSPGLSDCCLRKVPSILNPHCTGTPRGGGQTRECLGASTANSSLRARRDCRCSFTSSPALPLAFLCRATGRRRQPVLSSLRGGLRCALACRRTRLRFAASSRFRSDGHGHPGISVPSGGHLQALWFAFLGLERGRAHTRC